jgi:hypothetical protein
MREECPRSGARRRAGGSGQGKILRRLEPKDSQAAVERRRAIGICGFSLDFDSSFFLLRNSSLASHRTAPEATVTLRAPA